VISAICLSAPCPSAYSRTPRFRLPPLLEDHEARQRVLQRLDLRNA
jgi:hypothetical protein